MKRKTFRYNAISRPQPGTLWRQAHFLPRAAFERKKSRTLRFVPHRIRHKVARQNENCWEGHECIDAIFR